MESCLIERDGTNLPLDRLTASDRRHLLATNELSNSVHFDYYSSITQNINKLLLVGSTFSPQLARTLPLVRSSLANGNVRPAGDLLRAMSQLVDTVQAEEMDQLVEGGPDGAKQQRRVELAHGDRGQQTMAVFVDDPLDSGHAGQVDVDVQRFDTPDADSVGQDAGEVGVVDADVAHGTVGTGVDRQHAPGRHVAGHDHEAAGAVDRICGEAVAGQRHRVLAGPSDRGSGPAIAVDGAASVGDCPQKRPQTVEPDQHVRVHVDVETVGGTVFDNPLQHAQRLVAQIAVRVQVVSLENVAVVVGLLTGVCIDDVQRRPTDDEYNSADQRRRPSASNCLSLVEFRYARFDYHQIITITSRAGTRRTAARTQHIGGQDAQTAFQWESSVFVVGDHGAGVE
ncbi:hypothetical protein T05_12675 [Trichinella murrelli]|uniref:Uncharacterized protein n=1 Tax=Trichinella murrelli TaxID=144512 RepID=A0A0V0TFN4_9BILA|nr:hypothetical protein T05_12675 [Trichinella murrelli]